MNPISRTDIVHLSQLQFAYQPGQLILDIPDLRLQKGERVFLYGPSGSGKTTLLEVIAGVLAPQQGQVSILQQDLQQLSSAGRDQFRASHFGYVFQMFNLLPYLSAEQNILLPLHLSQNRQQRAEKQNLQQIYQRLGIESVLGSNVTQLSVGQQQRVAVARALVGRPEIILADEPTSALDYEHREKFIELLFEMSRENESTVLFVSHDISLEKLFDRVVSLPDINRVRP